MEKQKAVVAGMIANYAVGGMVWDNIQYALCLEKMGYDVSIYPDATKTRWWMNIKWHDLADTQS